MPGASFQSVESAPQSVGCPESRRSNNFGQLGVLWDVKCAQGREVQEGAMLSVASGTKPPREIARAEVAVGGGYPPRSVIPLDRWTRQF
jgi:hypothetical protein